MKVKDFNLQHWHDCLVKFREINKDTSTPPAIRCEFTQFTTARHYGGMTYNGKKYTYFEPVVPDAPNNPDGSPYVAWLMVREDFLRFAMKEAKKMESTQKKKDDSTQGELGL